MYSRLLQTTRRNSFFLFGARGTGKTTWMRDAFDPDASLYLDLLDPEVEDLYRRTPGRLERQVGALPDSVEWVLIARAGALARSLMIRAVSLLSVTTGVTRPDTFNGWAGDRTVTRA